MNTNFITNIIESLKNNYITDIERLNKCLISISHYSHFKLSVLIYHFKLNSSKKKGDVKHLLTNNFSLLRLYNYCNFSIDGLIDQNNRCIFRIMHIINNLSPVIATGYENIYSQVDFSFCKNDLHKTSTLTKR
jgi:hypothetical protein